MLTHHRTASFVLFLAAISFVLLGHKACLAEPPKPNLHALVIGNGDYSMGKLKNPTNDADTIAKALKGLGFEVTLLKDANQLASEDAVLDFSRSIGKDGLAFFFFAGHGVQVKGENYLIPTDARIREEFEVKHQCISLGLILDALENSRSNLNVVVLDCCRDNPFARSWSRSSRSGLAATTDIPEGTLIAFATPPGKTAADGSGNNSPFTSELATALTQRPAEGLLLRDVFFEASRRVKKKSGQSPWVNMEASLPKYYLTRPSTSSVAAADSLPPSPISSEPSDSFVPPSPSPTPADQEASTAPTSIAKAAPADTHIISPLEQQANSYLRTGDFDNAIVAYGAIISDPTLPPETHRIARIARGSAYLSRGRAADLDLAIIDYKAAGKAGIRIPVRSQSAVLKVGKEIRGSVVKNQTLLITIAQGDWLWVQSINDDESLQGYVKKNAVLEPTTSVAPATADIASQISTSPIVQPQTGSQVQNSVPPGAIQYDTNGQPLNPVVQGSQGIPYAQGQPGMQPQTNPSQPIYLQPNGQPQNQNRSYVQGQTYPQNPTGAAQPRNYSPRTVQQQPFPMRTKQQPGSGILKNLPMGIDGFTKQYMQRHGRPPTIWETPQWESLKEIRSRKRQGLLR